MSTLGGFSIGIDGQALRLLLSQSRSISQSSLWPYLPVLERLGLAIALGLFVGLERERRDKEAGIRTFGFAALIGGLGGLLGVSYALFGLGFLALQVVIFNWHTMVTERRIELTTSSAFIVTGFVGVLAGQGHTLTPTAVAVATVGLLAVKERLRGLSATLTETELRAAILLGVLAFVIYPALPSGTLDRWGLIDARAAWVAVVLIATIGFIDYVLLKLYGAKGIALAGFLAGLVNSKVAITELASRTHDGSQRYARATFHGVILATIATVLRNAGLLLLLAPAAFAGAAVSFGLMIAVCAIAAYYRGGPSATDEEAHLVPPDSPFSLRSVLQFGLLFLVLQVAGTLAERALGSAGFYVVSVVGGLVSSASSVASAARLQNAGAVSASVAGTGVVLTTLTSLIVNQLLFSRLSGDRGLTRRLVWVTGSIVLIGIAGVGVQVLIQDMLGFLA